MKILFSIFLLLHGLIHTSFITPAPPAKEGSPVWPFEITKSWILTPLGIESDTLKIIGTILVIVSTLGFLLSAIGWFGLIPVITKYWVIITVIASISSILLIIIFWNKWFLMGPIIDVLLILAIYFKDLAPK